MFWWLLLCAPNVAAMVSGVSANAIRDRAGATILDRAGATINIR